MNIYEKIKKDFGDYIISMPKFLSRYELITGKDLKKVTHDDVKEFFPMIKRTSFDHIELDQELVYSGRVLLVKDSKGEIIPYFAPEIEQDLDYIEISFTVDKNIEPVSYDYCSMSNYELKSLVKNRFSSFKNRRKARTELQERGIVLGKRIDKKRNRKKDDDYGEY